MSAFGLGIDAGGTYTDTVIVEMDTGRVVCGNKALTTRNDLSIGIRESLSGLDKDILKTVSLTSLSSTLATNSVVEGKGCRVGLICIGTGCDNSARADIYAEVEGKFSFSGKEIIPLDEDSVRNILASMKGRIDALAISGYISVRNSTHEVRVTELANEILGIPVVCAHDLTSKLGYEQRTTTAVMNARLIPVIQELLHSVKEVLKEFEIVCPLMMVKGDGALMKSDVALEKPVETILSGPASSMIGAKALTGRSDAMIIDMGGTTSDIGILKDGFPRIEPEGASIGGKRTRVTAADISTYGIGGDSRIVVNGKETILSSIRAIPLCIAASKWPLIKAILDEITNVTDDRSPESYPLEEIVQDTEFFTLAHFNDINGLAPLDVRFLNLLADGPMRLTDAGKILGVPAHAISAAELESRGCITRIGVTPTDLLHAEGSYSQYDCKASSIAVGYLARKCSKTLQQFIDETKYQIVKKIALSAMEKAMLDRTGNDVPTESDLALIDHVLENSNRAYSVGFTLNMPIIGIGAPVGAWLPHVAEMLHTELLLPENSGIGNAIGAITGSVSETVSVTVRAKDGVVEESPECIVFTGTGTEEFSSPAEALSYAKELAEKTVCELALKAGSAHPVVDVSVSETYYDLSDTQKAFHEATITAKAVGKPDLY